MPTVLIVDDDHDVRIVLDEFLASQGFDAALAETAADAIHFLDENEPPCAVLVDMVMPGIIGTSLLEYMAHEPRLASIPVAIVSGSPQLAPPGYRVFRKPIDPRALVDFLSEARARNLHDDASGCRPMVRT